MSLVSEIKEFLGDPPSTPTHSAGGHGVPGPGSTALSRLQPVAAFSGAAPSLPCPALGLPCAARAPRAHRSSGSSLGSPFFQGERATPEALIPRVSLHLLPTRVSLCSTDLFVFDLIVSGEREKPPASLGNLPGLLWALRGVGLGH